MTNRYGVIIVGGLLISISAFAKKVGRTPAQNSISVIELSATVQLGDKTTTITISKDGIAHTISISGAVGDSHFKALSESDFRTIITTFEKLPNTNLIPIECSRAFIVVIDKPDYKKSIIKRSCFGVKSISTKQFVDFSNLLLLAL